MRRLTVALREHPDLIGFGIDEQTALEVDVRNRRARVLGRSYVVAYVPASASAAGTGEPRLEILKSGDEADLDGLKTPAAHAVAASMEIDGVE